MTYTVEVEVDPCYEQDADKVRGVVANWAGMEAEETEPYHDEVVLSVAMKVGRSRTPNDSHQQLAAMLREVGFAGSFLFTTWYADEREVADCCTTL
jgi:hypothetical protein